MANGTLTVGRIFGIGIELDWIFVIFIIFCLLFFSSVTVLIIVLLFICVLIHELSHSITSLRNGIAIRRIVLTPIGGMSVMDEINIDPKVEFNISIVGPITNLFIGGLFGIAVLFTPPGIITFIFQELFLINIILGVSNIIPAFPMDGARVLRSYLQRRMDSYSATMTTVKISRYCIALILIGSVAIFFIPNSYSLGYKEFLFLIDLFIMYFLYLGTNAERDNVIVRKATQGVRLEQAVSDDYALADYNSKASSLYPLIKSKKEHIILCKTPSNGYALVDILGRNEINANANVKNMLISIPNLPPSTSLLDAMARLDSNSYRVAAIVKDGKLLGIATATHITAFIALHTMSRRRKDLNK